ncbi:ubiquinol-cytochrome c reductase iron-sulfur subunit [Streptomyces sp. cmx-4-7]|uniref:QcrA and Rieske domain-containing protein n=1 Tax=Streptomyces sp. cmx-4-7 TaxID=2790939 RepID=UPI003981911A
MSVTDPQPPAPGPRTDAAQDALHDRIAADSLTTRRDYLRIVTTVSGGLAVGGIGVAAGILHRHGDSEGAPEPKKIADRIPPGGSLAFRYPGADDRAVAVRLEDGTLAGYSAVCTHLACAVLWRKNRGSEGELYCPCHEGVFDARTGEVTAGPPPRGLPKVLLVEETDGSVWAVGTARSGESAREGLCRELGPDRPDLATRLGCPGATAEGGGTGTGAGAGVGTGAGTGAGVGTGAGAGARVSERSERT